MFVGSNEPKPVLLHEVHIIPDRRSLVSSQEIAINPMLPIVDGFEIEAVWLLPQHPFDCQRHYVPQNVKSVPEVATVGELSDFVIPASP